MSGVLEDAKRLERYERLSKLIGGNVAILKDVYVCAKASGVQLLDVLEPVTRDLTVEADPQLFPNVLDSLFRFGNSLGHNWDAPVFDLSFEGDSKVLIEEISKKLELRKDFSEEMEVSLKAKSEADTALSSALAVQAELARRFGGSASASTSGIALKCEQKVLSAKEQVQEAKKRLEELEEMRTQVLTDMEFSSLENSLHRNLVAMQEFARLTFNIIVSTLGNSPSYLSPLFNSVSLALETFQSLLANISKPSDLHMEISSLENQLEEINKEFSDLEIGSGPIVEKVLAERGVNISSNQNATSESANDNDRCVHAIEKIGYSLPLPLKDGRGKQKFWCGLQEEEKHADLLNVVILPEEEEDLEISEESSLWDIVAYEQILLSYYYIHEFFGSTEHMSLEVKERLRLALQLGRAKLKVSTRVHHRLTALMLPDVSGIKELTPLDLRFRIARLICAPVPDSESSPSDEEVYIQWVDRQLEVFRFAVNAWYKELPEESNSLAEIATLVESIAIEKRYPPKRQDLFDLLDACTDFSKGSALYYPRGVTNVILKRMWKCVVEPRNETGLHVDASSLISVIYNVTTARKYKHHALIAAMTLWETCCMKANNSAIPKKVTKTVRTILEKGNDWVTSEAGDWFCTKQTVGGFDESENLHRYFYRAFSGKEAYHLDLAYLRLLTAKARSSVIDSLTDYRLRLEPESLSDVLLIWRALYDHVNAGIPPMRRPTNDQLETHCRAMLEFFLVESSTLASARLLDTSKFLDPLAVARAHANDEARHDWLVSAMKSIYKCSCEVACEKDMFSGVWKSVGLERTHVASWTSALKGKVREIIELLSKDDDLWPTDRIPLSGAELICAIETWERISNDVGLIDILKKKILTAINVRMDAVEHESIPKCMHADHDTSSAAWVAAKPPQILYSSKCVDLWSTINTATLTCMQSVPLVVGIYPIMNLVSRSVESYCKSAMEGFDGDTAKHFPLSLKASRCFNRLLKGQQDIREVPDLFKEKNRKNFSSLSSSLKLGDQTGSSSSKSVASRFFKKKSQGSSLLQQFDQKKPSVNVAAGSDDEAAGDTGHPVNIISDTHMFKSEYLLAVTVLESHACTALMVRMQDLSFCLGELDKLRTLLLHAHEEELDRLEKSLRNYQRIATNISVPSLEETALAAHVTAVKKGIQSCVDMIERTMPVLIQVLALRLVQVDLRESLFSSLYVPACSSYTLADAIQKFQADQWSSFIALAPNDVRLDLATAIFAHFVYSWVYVVTDMGLRNRQFSQGDVSVILADSESLYDLTYYLDCNSSSAVQELLRFAGCLHLVIGEDQSFNQVSFDALREPNDKEVPAVASINKLSKGRGMLKTLVK